MNVVRFLATASFAVQMAAALVALAISRAPGWSRARIAAALAGTAALYSGMDLLGTLLPRTGLAITVVWSVNLTLAAAHVAVWIWFSFSGADGRWDSVPRVLRLVSVGHVGWTALLALAGQAVDLSQQQRVQVEWLGVDFVQPSLTPLASLSAVLSIVILLISFAEQVRQARRGVVGAKWNALGFAVYVSCAVEEILVASDLLQFIYLAELGYLGLVIPVIAQFVRRFTDDAHRMQELSQQLERQVVVATSERDAARDALSAQERFAAVGRMAGGVAHEINNPLQILTLSLDELQESPAATADPRIGEMVGEAASAADRISRIVGGLRVYTVPSDRPLTASVLDDIVRAAIAAAYAEHGRGVEIRADLRKTPHVLVDRDRMLLALRHALANAQRAASSRTAGEGRVEVTTREGTDGQVILEVSDNGPGFPDALLARLGEPFLTTQQPGQGMGLGVFAIRGVVAAHGGLLELENAPDGGAVLRIVLPAAASA